MNETPAGELELTPDLLEYAKAIALKEAKERCPKYVVYRDVVQEVLLQLISKPPKYDPARGASPKTFIHTIVRLAVLKYIARQCQHADRFGQLDEALKPDEAEKKKDGHAAQRRQYTLERRLRDLKLKCLTTEDILAYIDDEDSRALCRLVIECEGNMSEAARRLGVAEGTVRYRLKMLAPKLIAAGFDPFNTEAFK